MKNIFNLENFSEEKCKKLNSQTLAFVGDAVYSLFVRNKVIQNPNIKIKDLHSTTTKFVKAVSQSKEVENILPNLSETELEIYKRARNHKTKSMAKNASSQEYKRATGFEALIGYLYLTAKIERLNIILNSINIKGE